MRPDIFKGVSGNDPWSGSLVLIRHGREPNLSPSQVNYRANIHALKEEIERGCLVMPDQFVDFTRHRRITIFDSFKTGARGAPMADPFNNAPRRPRRDWRVV